MRYNIYHWYHGTLRQEYVADLHVFVELNGPIQLRMPGALNHLPNSDPTLWSIYITDNTGKFSQK